MIKENELPDGWIIKPFIECIEKEATANKLKIPKNNFQDIGEYAIIDQGAKYIAGYTDDSNKVYKGDLPIIIFGDHTRFFKYIDFQFALGADGTKILVPKKSLFNPKYLYYFLNGLKIEDHGYSRHYKFLKEKQIIVPPLPTQTKIVAILEKAERLREWRSEADELTDEFLKSTFLEMFGDPVENTKGWEKIHFNKVCQTRLGKMLDKKKQTGLHSKPYLRNANVQWKKIDLSSVFEMDFNDAECDEFLLRKGDILICEGGDIGRTAMWNDELPECYFQKALHRARPFLNVATPEFIVNLMFILGKYNGFRNFTSQSTIAHLTGVELKRFPIILPPLSLQQQFTSIVQQVEQMRTYQNQSKQHIDDLFNTLMQKAFRGELEA